MKKPSSTIPLTDTVQVAKLPARVIPIRNLLTHDNSANAPIVHTLHDDAGDLLFPLQDSRGRSLRDLRISVTDRCNFRCTYCMPKSVFDRNYRFLPQSEVLSFEEIYRLARLFVQCGVEKIRLTGGEPLLRKHLETLIAKLTSLTTLSGKPVELTLTTNAALLPQKARALKDAGLDRVTVSLDAIDDAIFRRMNDVDFSVAHVLEGITAAQNVGFKSIKINTVVRRGVNEDQIEPLAQYFRNSGHILRFIEFMDVGSSNGWRMDEVVPSRSVLDRLSRRWPLVPLEAQYSGEVAERWAYADGQGEVGFISSVTQAFCHSCTRARLSVDGRLYTCLFATQGLDFRTPLRQGATDQILQSYMAKQWQGRNDRYSEIRHAKTPEMNMMQDTSASIDGVATLPERKIEMSYIGG